MGPKVGDLVNFRFSTFPLPWISQFLQLSQIPILCTLLRGFYFFKCLHFSLFLHWLYLSNSLYCLTFSQPPGLTFFSSWLFHFSSHSFPGSQVGHHIWSSSLTSSFRFLGLFLSHACSCVLCCNKPTCTSRWKDSCFCSRDHIWKWCWKARC